MIPWFIVHAIGEVAWWLEYDTTVLAQGGPGWHRGRLGADRIYFHKSAPGARRLPRLKPRRRAL